VRSKPLDGRAVVYVLLALSLSINAAFVASKLAGYPLEDRIASKLKSGFERIRGAEGKSLPPGRWERARDVHGRPSAAEEELLKSIGYASGTQRAPAKKGVTIYDPKLAYNGLNLYVSGHAPEAILMDMRGNVLHKWRLEAKRVWSDFKPPEGNESYHFWRRAYMYPNGDLIAIFDGIGLIKIDRDSNLIWAYDGRAHHDIFVADDGRIYTLTVEPKLLPEIDATRPVFEEFVVVLDESGRELKKVSIVKCLENSDYAPVLKRIRVEGQGDILHTNTVELLDGRLSHISPAFKKGNVLISIRYLDLVAVVDLDAERVEWALTGLWRWQHDPTILENGHMLVFDNLGLKSASRVIEIDPFTQEVYWEYAGTPDAPFFTESCGSNQRLPNGNTLITESEAGRAFEITPDKRIVWEFYNPHRAGEHDELIATLFDLVRLEPDFPTGWLSAR